MGSLDLATYAQRNLLYLKQMQRIMKTCKACMLMSYTHTTYVYDVFFCIIAQTAPLMLIHPCTATSIHPMAPRAPISMQYIYIWIAHNEYTMITMFLRTVENHIEITIVTSYSSEPYNVCDAPVYSRTFLVANYQFKWPTIKPFQHALAVASHDKHMHLFSSTITEDLSLKTTTCWQDVSQTTNSYDTWICNIYI